MRDLTSYRCLVTGSRSWDDEQTIFKALDAVAFGAEGGGYARLVIVHGACPKGGDATADKWIRLRSGDFPVTAERHPALWEKYPRRAGIIRNESMVALGAHLALAFIRDGSAGASHCAELADEVGIPLQVFHYGQPGVVNFTARHLTDEEVSDALD
jgi:hypothetical protein